MLNLNKHDVPPPIPQVQVVLEVLQLLLELLQKKMHYMQQDNQDLKELLA